MGNVASPRCTWDGCSQIPAPAVGANWDAEPCGQRQDRHLPVWCDLFFALQPARDFNASLSFNAFLSPSFRITLVVLMFLPQDRIDAP